MNNYQTLVKLQCETIGCSFTIAYSLRRGKSVLNLSNKRVKFEDENISVVIQQAIEYIIKTRKPHPVLPQTYTIHDYKYLR